MKFLLVGGLGYIGSVLQDELTKAGHQFEIVDNDIMDLHDWHHRLNIIDYDNLNTIMNMVSNSDVIVNLAAIVGDQACLVDPHLAIKINCQGAQHIVNICNKFNKKLIQASTCSIYGESDDLLTEESQTFPVDFYGQTKYQQERHVIENSKNYCVFRFGTAYGWSTRMRFDLVVNTFTAKVYNKEKLAVFGGEQWRPFVHIRDISRAIIFAGERDLKGIYNLSNENLTIKELATTISNNKVLIEVNTIMSDPRNYKVSNKKLTNAGFKFNWTIKKGVEEMTNHPEALKDYNNTRYSNYALLSEKIKKR